MARYQQLHPQATSFTCFLLLCEGGGHLRRRDVHSMCVCIKGIKKQTCPMGNTNLQGFISCTSLELIIAIHLNLRFSSTTNIFFGTVLLNLIFFGLRTFDTFKYVFYQSLYLDVYTISKGVQNESLHKVFLDIQGISICFCGQGSVIKLFCNNSEQSMIPNMY